MRVIWSPRATRDLKSQCNYIARDRPKAALDVAERVVDAVNRLAEFPLSASVATGKDTRGVPVTHTGLLIIYKIDDDALRVVTIRHQMRRPLQR